MFEKLVRECLDLEGMNWLQSGENSTVRFAPNVRSEDAIDGACSMHGRVEEYVQNFGCKS